MIFVSRIVVLVREYSEALAFYEQAFGFSIIHDHTSASGQRFVHIGPEGHDTGIWLLESEDESRIGEQTGGEPVMTLTTDDLLGLHAHLTKSGVIITSPITRTPEASFFHCHDLYGNGIVITQFEEL